MKPTAKHTVIEVQHEDGATVLCWGREQGIEVVQSCLRVHPEQEISVKVLKMTEAEYDALPDYEGDC